MNINAKINTLAVVVRDIVNTLDPKSIDSVRRYNMLKDIDRILNDQVSNESAENSDLNGRVLYGSTDSDRSRAAFRYYMREQKNHPKAATLYIITSATKRDEQVWENLLGSREWGVHDYKIVVDSWHNIKKYSDVTDEFFVFDGTMIFGKGELTKTFVKLARKNSWIASTDLSYDRMWIDYAPVFVASGFYNNKTDFMKEHVVFTTHCPYPKIEYYKNTDRLFHLRDKIFIKPPFQGGRSEECLQL